MGERIDFRDGRWVVPDCPTIPFIEGDGTGPDIWRAARRVFDAALGRVSGGKRRVEWLEMLAGEKAFRQTGSWLPDATLDTIREYRVAIKGPLTTPVGGGIRSLNVALRQLLDLYAWYSIPEYTSSMFSRKITTFSFWGSRIGLGTPSK